MNLSCVLFHWGHDTLTQNSNKQILCIRQQDDVMDAQWDRRKEKWKMRLWPNIVKVVIIQVKKISGQIGTQQTTVWNPTNIKKAMIFILGNWTEKTWEDYFWRDNQYILCKWLQTVTLIAKCFWFSLSAWWDKCLKMKVYPTVQWHSYKEYVWHFKLFEITINEKNQKTWVVWRCKWMQMATVIWNVRLNRWCTGNGREKDPWTNQGTERC